MESLASVLALLPSEVGALPLVAAIDGEAAEALMPKQRSDVKGKKQNFRRFDLRHPHLIDWTFVFSWNFWISSCLLFPDPRILVLFPMAKSLTDSYLPARLSFSLSVAALVKDLLMDSVVDLVATMRYEVVQLVSGKVFLNPSALRLDDFQTFVIFKGGCGGVSKHSNGFLP
jgi:hypothetical protein